MVRALLLFLGLACSPVTREAASFQSTTEARPLAPLEDAASAWRELRSVARALRRDTAASIDTKKALHAGTVQLSERSAKSPAAIPILVERARLAAALDRAGIAEGGADRDRALALLVSDHAAHAELGRACEQVGGVAVDEFGFEVVERFFAAVRAKSALPEVRDGADLGLARARHDAIDALPSDAIAKLRAGLSALSSRVPADRRSRAAADLLFAWEHLRILRAAPEVDARDLDGKPLRVADFAGRVVLVVFWSTLDARTRDELEAHSKRANERREQPFVLLRVHAEEDPAVDEELAPELRSLLDRHGRIAPKERALLAPEARAGLERIDELDRIRTRAVLRGLALAGIDAVDGSTEGPWSRRWDVRRHPATVLLDARGRIRFRDLPANELELSIGMLLREAEADTKR